MSSIPEVTRDNQQPDRIYVVADDHLSETIFVTPDGVGRFYYDSVDEAEDQHGFLPVVHAERCDD